MAVVDTGGPQNMSVLINNGNGTFAPAVTYNAAGATCSEGVHGADFDGDGDLDMVVSNLCSANITFFPNNGNGTFGAPVNYSAQGFPDRIFAADLDNDGDIDAVNSNAASLSISVHINNGDGTFASAVNYSTAQEPRGIIAQDFNGDGFADIVTGNNRPTNTVSVLLNNGDGTFGARVDYSPGNRVRDVFVADVDADGDLDILAQSTVSGTTSVLLNDGAGNFVISGAFTTGSNFGVASADFNGDGAMDIVASNVSVLLADGPPQITIIQPNGGETLTPGTFFDIIWTATDDSGPVSSIDLEYQVNPFLTVPGGTGLASGAEYPFLLKWGSFGSADGKFANPNELDIDSNGNVYVADFNNHRIQVFDSSGTFLNKWGTLGAAAGLFTNPTGLALDSSGNVYIGDQGNHRIQKFDSNGAFITEWGSFGSADGEFQFPAGVDVDSANNVYVADQLNNRIQKFDSNGGFITKWGTVGTGDGQFNVTRDVVSDSAGNIYVTDLNNNRIQKFDNTGSFITKWGSGGSGDGQFIAPRGVGVDPSGDVFVVDAGNNRIQKFDNTGSFITKWGSSGTGDGQFKAPRHITFNSSGEPYVSELQNNRIQKFGPGGTFSWLVPGDETVIGLIQGTATDGLAQTGQDQSDAFFNIDAPVCLDAPSDLVSWWPGDGNANDIEGTNDGSLQNGAAFVTGRVDEAFSFDGAGGQVEILDDPTLRLGTQFTIDAWFNTNDVNQADPGGSGQIRQAIVSYGFGAPSGKSIGMNIFEGKIELVVRGAGLGFDDLLGTTVIGSNESHHAAVTYDGATANLYLDGVLEDSRTTTINIDSNARTLIGRFQNPQFFNQNYDFNGFIDEVEIFDRPLSTVEIQSIYAAGTAGKCKPAGGISPLVLSKTGPLLRPTAQDGQALSSTSLHLNFQDNSVNEDGFEILDALGNVLLAVSETNLSSIDLTDLQPNTLYSGLTIRATNLSGTSEASEPFLDIVTLMPEFTPKLISFGSVTVGVEEEIPNLDLGQSGIQFELMTLGASGFKAAAVFNSGWIQEETYTFDDPSLTAGTEFQARVRARNQAGVETEFSQFSEPQTVPETVMPIINATMEVRQADGSALPITAIDPSTLLRINFDVTNAGSGPATNVFANVILGDYLIFASGSLTVDGAIQSDAADEDVGQGNSSSVSTIWPTLMPGEGHMVSFLIAFDQEALRMFASADATAIFYQALVAANPNLSLQTTVSYLESAEVVSSNEVSFEVDVSGLQPLAPPPPVEIAEPEPTEFVVLPPTAEEVETIEKISEVLEEIFEEEKPDFLLTADTKTVGDRIEITGVTAEPNSVITVVINGTVTIFVSSDENGLWQTFITAEEFGLKPGQEMSVKIESVAVKGDLKSNVVVRSALLALSKTGEELIFLEPAPVEAVNILTQFTRQAVVVIEEQQEEIQATLTIVAPVVIISSAPLVGYLPYLPTLIYHFFSYLVGLLGRKKKKERVFGVVYDSITKEPLALAILRIYDQESNKLISTKVTDKKGRYDVLLNPGKYRLEVRKPGYDFPSAIVTAQIDGDYTNVYNQEVGLQQLEGGEITIPDIPLDPRDAKREFTAAGVVKKLWLSVQKVGHYLAVPVLFVGALVSVLVLAAIPDNPLNWVFALFYIGLFFLQLKLRTKVEKSWGVVYEIANNAVLPLTTVQLIDPEYGKVVKSRLSDYQGRFAFLPDPGSYVVKASKEGFEQTEVVEAPVGRTPITAEVSIKKPNQRITGDIGMKERGSMKEDDVMTEDTALPEDEVMSKDDPIKQERTIEKDEEV